jgi:hypothetical protein
MAVFGNPDSFAVEIAFDGALPDGYCLVMPWVAGKRLGVADEPFLAHTFRSHAHDFIGKSAFREIPGSQHIGAAGLFARLFDDFMITALPGETIVDAMRRAPPRSGVPSYQAASRIRDIFYLDEILGPAVLDRENLVLVNEPSLRRQRLIRRDLDTMQFHEYMLPLGTVEDALTAAAAWNS